jgi:hypothetical protein
MQKRSSQVRSRLSPLQVGDLEIIHRVITTSEYEALCGALLDVLSSARLHRGDPDALMTVQAELMRNTLELRAERSQLILQLAALAPGKVRHDSRYVVVKRIDKALAAMRDVADGMAWRASSYNRNLIRELSSGHQGGHVQPGSSPEEGEEALAHVRRTGDTVVLNDLTNCLRFGDYTAFIGSDFALREVKSGMAARRNAGALQQKKRLAAKEAQIRANLCSTPSGQPLTLIRAAVDAVTYAPEVAQLLRESMTTIRARSRLSEVFAIEIVRPALVPRGIKLTKYSPFGTSDAFTRFDTLQLFDDWSPNFAPFSIVPFDLADRIAVLMGSAVIFIYFNFDALIRIAAGRGFDLVLPSTEDLLVLQGLRPSEIARHTLVARFRKRGDARTLRVNLSSIGRMIFELINAHTIIDLLEWMYETAVPERHYLPQFQNEAALWD